MNQERQTERQVYCKSFIDNSQRRYPEPMIRVSFQNKFQAGRSVCQGAGRFLSIGRDKVAWIRPPLPIGKGRKVFNLNLMDMRMGVSWQNLTEKSFYFFGV